jgi:hypothetical protein
MTVFLATPQALLPLHKHVATVTTPPPGLAPFPSVHTSPSPENPTHNKPKDRRPSTGGRPIAALIDLFTPKSDPPDQPKLRRKTTQSLSTSVSTPPPSSEASLPKRKLSLSFRRTTATPPRAQTTPLPPSSSLDTSSSITTSQSSPASLSLSLADLLEGAIQAAEQEGGPETFLRTNSSVTERIRSEIEGPMTSFFTQHLNTVVTVIKANRDLEIDAYPSPIPNLKERQDILINLCQTIINILLSTTKLLPQEMKTTLKTIVDTLDKNEKSTWKAMAVANTLFLRALNPYITNIPKNLPKEEKQHSIRLCTLITKILQKLVNGATFESREEHMLFANSFLEKNKDNLETLKCLALGEWTPATPPGSPSTVTLVLDPPSPPLSPAPLSSPPPPPPSELHTPSPLTLPKSGEYSISQLDLDLNHIPPSGATAAA